MNECIFCKISNGGIPSEKIYENENFFSVFDINPRIPGHTLIISKRHFENVLEMPNKLGVELSDCIKKTFMKLMEKYHADGFNVINNCFESAGQIVKHVHFHVLPRKKDDGLKLDFVDSKAF